MGHTAAGADQPQTGVCVSWWLWSQKYLTAGEAMPGLR